MAKRELKHSQSVIVFSKSCQINIYGCLCDIDIDMIEQVCKFVPPPPKDLVDAIVNDLHCYDCVLRNIPKDIVWKVLEYVS